MDSQPYHIEEAERMATDYEAEHPDSSREDALAATRTSLCQERDKMNQADEKISDQLAKRKFRSLVDDNQKLGNKMILGKHKPNPPIAMRAIARPDGSLATSAAEVLEATEQWARKKLAAPEPNGKTGLYLPEDVSRNYPWDTDRCFSEYKGLLEKTAPDGPRQWMHASIDDEVTFQSCMKTLAQGKAVGPDGVANELLQALPPSGKRALHNLLRIMWATGLTPTSWKGSITAMLYKKNTPLELNNYRRIGLEMTVYKVWTRMVTFAMADRAERQCILSASQAGFRSKRSTAQQIEMMVLALEDAYWFKQDIYLLQADMTEAFDTISHDKLLCILYDLGFPTDAIEVVKDLYKEAHTSIKTPYGSTPPIPIDRGTIQGDSLSPFLFVLYMEPLLRWLHAGDRGYKPGALTGASESSNSQISSVTYADDLNMLTGGRTGLQNMKHQAHKVDAYTTWGHLIVNNTKTTVTGALHGTQPQRPYDCERLRDQLEGRIRMQNKPITFHHPKDPFRHLGVLLTMDLNYKPQLGATLTQLREAARAMKQSRASTAQKMRTLRTSLRPAVAHILNVSPFTPAELRQVDGVLARMAKQAHGLATSMPNIAAHEDTAKGGLGCPSLAVEQALISTQRLTRSLNDAGPLGVMSRAMLERQHHALNTLDASKLPHVTRYSLKVRQAAALHGTDMELRIAGQPSINMASMSSLAQGVQGISSACADWDVRLVADIHTLHELGIHDIEQMLSTDREKVLSTDALALLVAKRNIRPKHRSAWQRVAYYLRTGAPWTQLGAQPPPVQNSKIWPAFATNLKARWPVNPTAWRSGTQRGAVTGLHALSGMHLNLDRQAMGARDEVAEYVRALESSNQSGALTSHRQTVE
jgi:hypothetical protein